MNKTFSINGPMISGQGEQAVRTYKKVTGKKSIWYIAVQENPADNVYCTSIVRSGRSDGFGGASLNFKLEDGTTDTVQGPWHSNADSLLSDTGYDITNQYLTQGIVASQKTGTMLDGYEYIDVLHYDEEPVLGSYHRIEEIAQKFANEKQCTITYAMKSSGGGCTAYKEPK